MTEPSMDEWKRLIELGKRIQDEDDEANLHYTAIYKSKVDGTILDRMPKEPSPLIKSRGRCTSCERLITEATPDDRFCVKCYDSIFGMDASNGD